MYCDQLGLIGSGDLFIFKTVALQLKRLDLFYPERKRLPTINSVKLHYRKASNTPAFVSVKLLTALSMGFLR